MTKLIKRNFYKGASVMLSEGQIERLARYIVENTMDDIPSVTQGIKKWVKEEFKCRCSRCTGLPDIESYYEEQ